MNAARRKERDKIIDVIDAIIERLEALKDEEEEAFDNLPDSIQQSERGQQMEENAENRKSAFN